jgi:hypothetical protein
MENIICTNCGSNRDGLFCGQCGQNSRNYQRAFPPMLWDLIHETFELDSRVLRSIKLLLFKPGELACEFSRNRRASYVSPIRLYLFVSLCFFFLLSSTTEIDPQIDIPLETVTSDIIVPTENAAALLALLSPSRQAKVQEILASSEPTIQQQIILEIANGVSESPANVQGLKLFILRQAIDAVYEPRMVVRSLIDNLPIAMFMLLPVFALLLSAIYFNRHRYYVENLVFATHLHTFAFLIYILLLVLPEESNHAGIAAAAQAISSVLGLVLLIYHVAALKRYYGESMLRTCLKYIFQMTLYFLILIPTAFSAVLVFTLATV